jgi:hypothetical protein
MAVIGTVVTLVARPDPDSFLAYCDLNDLQSLPTWWATVVLGLAAIAAALVGRTAAVDRRWWFAASGALLLFSLCVFTTVHQRLDGLARQALGSNLLTERARGRDCSARSPSSAPPASATSSRCARSARRSTPRRRPPSPTSA